MESMIGDKNQKIYIVMIVDIHYIKEIYICDD